MSRNGRGVVLVIVLALLGPAVLLGAIQRGEVQVALIGLLLAVPVWSVIIWYLMLPAPRLLGILRATYGSGDLVWDVRLQVDAQLVDGRLDFVVSTDIFGDPTPNVRKRLALRYTLDGEVHDGEFQDGTPVVLP